jgi:hypothetical protein
MTGSVPFGRKMRDFRSMAGLRNEDYVAFLDESGESGSTDLYVVSGVLIPARWLRSAERRWMDFVANRLGSRSGNAEVKSRELRAGKGVAIHAQRVLGEEGVNGMSARSAGRRVYREALEHIAGIQELRVLSIALPRKQATDVYRLWFWMVYMLLVEPQKAPHPRLPMSVIDGQDLAFRSAQDLVAHRFYRRFPRCRPYVMPGKPWIIGGSVLHDSRLHPFIQMADLISGAARHAIIESKTAAWYERHLLNRARQMGKDIDVSAHALSQLRRRSRTDACGSNWPEAILAPKPGSSSN